MIETVDQAPPDAAADGPPTTPAPSTALSADALWQRVVDHARHSPSDRAKIEPLQCISFDGRTLRLKPRDDDDPRIARFLAQKLDAIEAIVQRAIGQRINARLETEAAEPPRTKLPNYDEVRRLPLVNKALELFDASIVEVRDESLPG